MFSEAELLPISALQHLRFCPRQAALIHIERAWAENRLTVEGNQLHERAHSGATDQRRALRTARGVSLRSFQLGLFGVADVVEIHAGATPAQPPMYFPVEYKRGRPKRDNCDRVQLCAQALCLEEMLSVEIPAGALFYGKIRRRDEIEFTPKLRRETTTAAAELQELIRAGEIPVAREQRKCRSCSLKDICLPQAAARRTGARGYLQRHLRAIAAESEDA